MKVISNFEVTKGYEFWKKEFESNDTRILKSNNQMEKKWKL
jgi:hypothetical protein